MTVEQRNELEAMRKALDRYVSKIAESPAEINTNPAIIRAWMPGVFALGDVRMYEGAPYRCVQAHDGTQNPEWTPDITPSLWMQYHGTSADTARAWITPAGAHDMYKAGEYMLWTDGVIYKCIVDTVYSPVEYAIAWQKIETEA